MAMGQCGDLPCLPRTLINISVDDHR